MILVVGASGELGRRVVSQLLAAGHQVRALSRAPERASKVLRDSVEIVRGDLRDPASVAPAVGGCEAVIHCATGRRTRGDRKNTPHSVDDEGTATLVALCREAEVPRFIYVSALGASPDAPLETLRMKYRAEWHVLHSGMHFTILRPAAFAETWLVPLAGSVASGRSALLPGTVGMHHSFVSAQDVAALAVIALNDRDLEDRTIDVGSPFPVTLEQAVSAMERGAGRRVRRSYVPAWILLLGAWTWGLVDPGFAERLEYGWCVATHPMTCESAGLQRMLPKWRPSPIDELAEQFGMAQQATAGHVGATTQ